MSWMTTGLHERIRIRQVVVDKAVGLIAGTSQAVTAISVRCLLRRRSLLRHPLPHGGGNTRVCRSI